MIEAPMVNGVRTNKGISQAVQASASGALALSNFMKARGIRFLIVLIQDDQMIISGDYSNELKRYQPEISIPTQNENFRLVTMLNLKSYEDWVRYTKTNEFPDFLPVGPQKFYDESLRLGYRDFLNTPEERRSFEDAKKLVQQVIKDLNITGMDQWVKLGQSGKLPFNLPTRPERVYSAEWKDWWDWFGKPNTRDKNYLPFNEARAFARSLKLKTLKDWNSYLKQKTRPENIPYHPERAYKDAGWIGWKDWLQKT
jgi:hypothetical protein